MARHNIFGQRAERIAAQFLENQGYTILDRNWRSGHKELDLIASDGRTLVVVEVKARTTSRWGNAEVWVDNMKIRRIVNATDAYLRLKCIDLPVRFDIITIIGEEGKEAIEHIPDAFFAPMN